MSDNQENNRGIIDSYDGDPDDLVFFQSPLEEDMEEETEFEEEILYESDESEREREERAFQELAAEYRETIINENAQTEDSDSQRGEFVNTGIDLTDPHYANYTPDPYYEYGYGPEPKAKKTDDKKDGTTLGVVSLSTGIGANLMCCCGLSYILSFTAIVTGICCLCMKNKGKDAKVMAVIGIVAAMLPIVLMLINIFAPVFVDLLDSIIDNI